MPDPNDEEKRLDQSATAETVAAAAEKLIAEWERYYNFGGPDLMTPGEKALLAAVRARRANSDATTEIREWLNDATAEGPFKLWPKHAYALLEMIDRPKERASTVLALCRKCAGDPNHMATDLVASEQPCQGCKATADVFEWPTGFSSPPTPAAQGMNIYRNTLEAQTTPSERSGNAYGTVMHDDGINGPRPVICGHGGSMWLCVACARAIEEVRRATAAGGKP